MHAVVRLGLLYLCVPFCVPQLVAADEDGGGTTHAAPPRRADRAPTGLRDSERARRVALLTKSLSENVTRISRRRQVQDVMAELGDLQAVEAVDVLVTHITYPETLVVAGAPELLRLRRDWSAGQTPEQRYPAVAALVEIGDPCLDAVVRKVASTDDREESRACVAVLRRLDSVSVRSRLEAVIGEAEDARAADRLNDAMKQLDVEEPKPLKVEDLQKVLRQIPVRPRHLSLTLR